MDPKKIICQQPLEGEIEPGDILTEWGPRIGYRAWLVIDVRIPRTLVHCTCVRAESVEPGDYVWTLRRRAE